MSRGSDDPVALVTGGSRGIGAAVASRLVADGFDVWSIARAASIDSRVASIECDLSDRDDVSRLTYALRRDFARVDALVLNATVRNLGTVDELPPARWEEAVSVNVTSAISLIQAVLPALRESAGRIIVMGSHAGSIPFEGGLAYCLTKAALKPLTEILLLEERPRGVLTTLVSPGATANEASDPGHYKLTVDSVAETISWLLAAPSDLVVGEIEIRPSNLPPERPVTGFDRLQVV